jgi:predicted nucleotide-binding protein
MDKKEAMQFLRQSLGAIPNLASLSHDNYEYPLWRDQIGDVLEEVFGRDSTEYNRFRDARLHVSTYGAAQQEYNETLKLRETAILSIIKKYEVLCIIEELTDTVKIQPKTFIAHGGKTEARDKLHRFLIALGITPFIIEEEPKEGRSVNEQVEYYSEQADCAIILGTADDKELRDGKLYPRRNVYIEIGRFQERFPNRIIYLLEEGATFPSDISEKLYTRFTQESMDEALIAVAREFKAYGMLKTIRPEK